MRRYSYLWFLLGLIAMLIVAPIAQWGAIADFVHQGLFTIVVLLALNTVSEPGASRIAAAVCAVGWLIMSWALLLFGAPGVHIPAGSLLFCLFALVMYNILLLLFRTRDTDANVMSAAIAAYLMLGVAWAVSFDIIERIAPGSFRGLEQGPGWSEFLYFSMGTLTTVGYNNITPTNPSVGIWATLEAACGVLYVAVLISHLVARVRD
jgi:hypothetical protein